MRQRRTEAKDKGGVRGDWKRRIKCSVRGVRRKLHSEKPN